MNLKHEVNKTGQDRYKLSVLDIALITSGNIGAAYVAAKVAGRIDIPGTSLSNLTYLNKQTVFGMPWYEAMGRSLKNADGSNAAYTAADYFMNMVKAGEEQLMRIPRAFSASSLLSDNFFHTQLTQYMPEGFFVAPEFLKEQGAYLKHISEGTINSSHIQEGMFYKPGSTFRAGSLYSAVLDSEGNYTAGESLLDHANITIAGWNKEADLGKVKGVAKEASYNRYVQSLHHEVGLSGPKSDVVFTGGQGFFKAARNKATGVLRVGLENYFKMANDPFEMLVNPAEKFFGKQKWAPEMLKKGSEFYDRIGFRGLFGIGDWSEISGLGSSGQLLKKYATRALPVMAVGAFALKFLNDTISGLPLVNQTALGGGIKGAAAQSYQDVTTGFSYATNAVGLGSLSRWQEEEAPGSTNLTGLAAFPASFGIAGMIGGGLQNLMEKAPPGMAVMPPDFFTHAATALEGKSGIVGDIAQSLRLTEKSRVGAYGMIGAAIGAALVLPFIPGALGSKKTPSELSAIYSGEQLTPVRQGANWEAGSPGFEGGDIKYYAPHWSTRAVTNASARGKYGKFFGMPLVRGLKQMMDPYYLERDQDAERPYTYWGPTDHGFGFMEKALAPLKEIFKPTIVAHPEALSAMGPDQVRRHEQAVPAELQGTDLGLSNRNAIPGISHPNNFSSYLGGTLSSFNDALGLIGFTTGSLTDKISGSRGAFAVDAVHETSGRILSAERSYWDENYGGMGGLNEIYRRLNPKRPYGTDYVGSSIRNTQPDWMPEDLKFGDPYVKKELGELRLPGKGYETLHPEMKGVDYNDYPAIHRMNILQGVAPKSVEYYKAWADVRNQVDGGDASGDERQMYSELLRQREQKAEEEEYGRFDYGDHGVMGDYYLKLKQLGHNLPTESLLPVAPVHKLAGPVDPLTSYKSYQMLDSSFKSWEKPVSDYLVPTLNKVMNITTAGNFVPREYKQRHRVEDYFQGMQHAKNSLLDEQSKDQAAQGNFEAASYLNSGKRPTLYDTPASGDLAEMSRQMLPRERTYFKAFAEAGTGDRGKIARSVNPAMQSMLSAQWGQRDAMMAGDYENLERMQSSKTPIYQGGKDPMKGMPDRNFIGYAAGVNLNAMKVRVLDNMGKNLRDHNLWKEDERQARLTDTLIQGQSISKPMEDYYEDNREKKRQVVYEYMNRMNMGDVNVLATPKHGASVMEFHGKHDNKDRIHNIMRQEGIVTY